MGGISWFSSLKIKLERQGLRWLVVGLRGRELIGYKMMEMRLPGKGKEEDLRGLIYALEIGVSYQPLYFLSRADLLLLLLE